MKKLIAVRIVGQAKPSLFKDTSTEQSHFRVQAPSKTRGSRQKFTRMMPVLIMDPTCLPKQHRRSQSSPIDIVPDVSVIKILKEVPNSSPPKDWLVWDQLNQALKQGPHYKSKEDQTVQSSVITLTKGTRNQDKVLINC